MRAEEFHHKYAEKSVLLEYHHAPSDYDVVANKHATWRRDYWLKKSGKIGNYNVRLNGSGPVLTENLKENHIMQEFQKETVADITFGTKVITANEACSVVVHIDPATSLESESLRLLVAVAEDSIDYRDYFNHPWGIKTIRYQLWDFLPRTEDTYGQKLAPLAVGEKQSCTIEVTRQGKQKADQIRLVAILEDTKTGEVLAVNKLKDHPFRTEHWDKDVALEKSLLEKKKLFSVKQTGSIIEVALSSPSPYQVVLHDLTGREIVRKSGFSEVTQIDNALAKGVYLLSIETDLSIMTRKVVIH